jgi:hypothetical protein
MIGRETEVVSRKPATVALCPLHISHDLTWDQTRADVVSSLLLTARARHRFADDFLDLFFGPEDRGNISFRMLPKARRTAELYPRKVIALRVFCL